MMHQSMSSFEQLLFSFSSDFLTYQVNFSVFWALNLLLPSILFVSWLFLVLFLMLWMLVIMNKLKRMARHEPHASQKTTNVIYVIKFALGVLNEKSLVLLTRVLSNINKNLWPVFPKTLTRRRIRRNTKAIAKLFALHANATRSWWLKRLHAEPLPIS